MARKRLPDETAKRVTLNTRTTRPFRERLETAAIEGGRSIAQEVEFRLERSFAFDLLEESVGGAKNFAIGLRVSHLLDFYNIDNDQPWHETNEGKAAAIKLLLKSIPKLLRQQLTTTNSGSFDAGFDAAMMDAVDALPYDPDRDGRPSKGTDAGAGSAQLEHPPRGLPSGRAEQSSQPLTKARKTRRKRPS